MTRAFAFGRFAVTALAFAVITCGETSAKGLVLFTWGESISHLGDVPPSKLDDRGASKVGYKYAYHGMFWLDFWRSGGTYCLYEGDRYFVIPPAAAAILLDTKESELSQPFFYQFPPGLLVAGPLLLLWLISIVQDKLRDAANARLLEDPEYKTALQIADAEYAKQPDATQEERYRAAIAAGVEYLVGIGIERSEAEWNLETMIRTINHAAMNPQEAPPGYRIPCECGKTLAVTAGMAGTTATCACGRPVTVPSLYELKSM